MTSSGSVTAERRFGPFHGCQEINMVLPRRILRHADCFATEIGICSLDMDHVFQAEYPGSARGCSSAARSVRPRADVRGRRRETRSVEDSALLSSCLLQHPPLPEAQL